MVLSPYRFNSRHANRQRELATTKKPKNERLDWPLILNFEHSFQLRQKNIVGAHKALADYLTDCAAGKQKHSTEKEEYLRWVVRGYTTGKWLIVREV